MELAWWCTAISQANTIHTGDISIAGIPYNITRQETSFCTDSSDCAQAVLVCRGRVDRLGFNVDRRGAPVFTHPANGPDLVDGGVFLIQGIRATPLPPRI